MLYEPYGTHPDLDKMVKSTELKYRRMAAKNLYGFDVLKDDYSSYVREDIALCYKATKELDNDDIEMLKYLATSKNDPYVKRAVVQACHKNPDVLELLYNDPSEVVRCAVAREGYKLDVLCHDDAGAVLQCVVEQGYALDELINYTNPEDPLNGGGVQDEAKHWLTSHGFAPYGSNKMLDGLANDTSSIRVAVARQGYGLEHLMNDPDWVVRREVAKHDGFGYWKLMYDDNPEVREAVAYCGKGLDVLIDDIDPVVRASAVHLADNKYLERLVDDSNLSVRYSVAKRGYGHERLVSDDNYEVREAVAEVTTDETIIDALADDTVWSVRAALARSGKALDILIEDPVPAVRIAVAQGCKGNFDIMNILVNDEDDNVRWAVAECCKNNPDILNQLVNDDNYNVRLAATAVMKKTPKQTIERD